jgi:thiopurine S-methyltransferase
MHPEFWHKRWADNQIGFHESRVNPLLVSHVEALALPERARVFLPLCGKTLDIDWLLARGNRVAGAEISPSAVAQLFERLGIKPDVIHAGDVECHRARGLEVFVGDIFQLAASALGAVDAVYDRAALIALPHGMRGRYMQHMRMLAGGAPQLLITLEYDQTLAEGPPFPVSATELREGYPDREPQLLSSHFMPTGLKGRFPVTECAWKIGVSRAGESLAALR